MEELQQALRGKAQTAMNLLHQGICKTEQKLEQCLQVLASVQEEVCQNQEAQAHAIQEDYNHKLQELTESFEQQVLLLQQQTQQQLAELQTASEDALHQAAQVLSQELQLDSPARTAVATTLRPSSGSPAGSDVAVELSLAALQQHPDATQGLQQHTAAGCDWHHEMQQQDQQQQDCQEPTFSPSQPAERPTREPGWPAYHGVESVDAQHSSACSSRASSRCKKPAGAAASVPRCSTLQGATAAHHAAPGDTGTCQDVADTLWVPVQDQVVSSGVPGPVQQQYAEQAEYVQQQEEQGQQPHHVQQQHHGVDQHQEIGSHEPATYPKPARTASSTQAAGATAAASAAVAAAEPAQPAFTLDPGGSAQQRLGQRTGRRSRSSHGYSTQEIVWPRGRPAMRSCEDARHSPAFATPTDTPYRTQPWRPVGDVPTQGQQGEQQQQQQQQQQPHQQEDDRHTRQLKTLSSLPARWQPSAQSQPALRRCASHLGHAQPPSAAMLLKSALNLRQQLEAGWQQGLAKAAGRAAAGSLLDPHAVTAAERRLSKMHSRKASLVTTLDSSSSDSEGESSPTRSASRSPSRKQQLSRSPSARRSSEEGKGGWQSVLVEAQRQQHGVGVLPQGGGAGAKLATVQGGCSGSSGRRPDALSRSTSAATGRPVGSLALDLLD